MDAHMNRCSRQQSVAETVGFETEYHAVMLLRTEAHCTFPKFIKLPYSLSCIHNYIYKIDISILMRKLRNLQNVAHCLTSCHMQSLAFTPQ